MAVDLKLLAAQARALKAAHQISDAIAIYRQIVEATPGSAAAEHNLAAALGDAGRWRDAETHIRRALVKGADTPESWLVLGRCLQSLGRYKEAEEAFEAALSRRSSFGEAHTDLAQLRWMLTGNLAAALERVEQVMAAAPGDARLTLIKAQVLKNAGELATADAVLSDLASKHAHDAVIATTASQYAAEAGDHARALSLAERAATLAPQEPIALTALIAACLASGSAERAATLAAALLQRAPNDQYALALMATAWRLLGDQRYRALYDYDAFVFTAQLTTPTPWPDLNTYLADLADGLKTAHAFRTHPFHQSVRHGSQAPDILQHDHPAIAALPEALDPAIGAYLAQLGAGADPARARNRGGYSFQGMWSIRMTAGGFHVDHVHPQGWISSACYIEVPRNLEGKEGWLQFGNPGIRTAPQLDAEYFVEPASGKLVLFPSYMWHGTVPFKDPSTRLTIAFDLAPATPR